RLASNEPYDHDTAPASIATAHNDMLTASRRVRWRRSTSAPAGNVHSALTTLTTVASSPSSLLSSEKSCCSIGASAPTAPLSAASRASAAASNHTMPRRAVGARDAGLTRDAGVTRPPTG